LLNSFIKQDSHHDRKQKSNYMITDSSVSYPFDSVFAYLSKETIYI